ALADLGEEHGDLEDAEAVRRGHVEQAGPGEFLPGVRGSKYLGGQVGDGLLALIEGEVHHRGSPRTRSATWVSRIWVVPPAMDRHRVSRNSWLASVSAGPARPEMSGAAP